MTSFLVRENMIESSAAPSASDPIFSRDSIQQQIDAAVSAMAKLEPDEQRKQIKDLRLKYHP